MGSHGDGEALSLEIPKNETAKAQLGTVWENGVTGPSWGDSSASAGISWEGAPEVSGIIPVCPHPLLTQAAELDLSLLFQVLLFPSVPVLLSHTQTLCLPFSLRTCPLRGGPVLLGTCLGGLRAWWFHLHMSETVSEPSPSRGCRFAHLVSTPRKNG